MSMWLNGPPSGDTTQITVAAAATTATHDTKAKTCADSDTTTAEFPLKQQSSSSAESPGSPLAADLAAFPLSPGGGDTSGGEHAALGSPDAPFVLKLPEPTTDTEAPSPSFKDTPSNAAQAKDSSSSSKKLGRPKTGTGGKYASGGGGPSRPKSSGNTNSRSRARSPTTLGRAPGSPGRSPRSRVGNKARTPRTPRNKNNIGKNSSNASGGKAKRQLSAYSKKDKDKDKDKEKGALTFDASLRDDPLPVIVSLDMPDVVDAQSLKDDLAQKATFAWIKEKIGLYRQRKLFKSSKKVDKDARAQMVQQVRRFSVSVQNQKLETRFRIRLPTREYRTVFGQIICLAGAQMKQKYLQHKARADGSDSLKVSSGGPSLQATQQSTIQ